MKISPKPLILGAMITGGVALTVAGTRELSGYIYTITVAEQSTIIPPGFMLILFGTASLCFSIGYITGEKMIEQ